MNTITVNGTTFTGEMILDAVARTTGFPKLGMWPIWHPHQLVTSQEYDSIKQAMVFDYHMNLIKEEEIPAGPYYGIMEKNLGGWRFLYYSDGRGNWYTEHFSF